MPKISKYNGGYVIISLNDEDIYEKIERNLYKPILLTDIVINGIEKNDVFTTAYVEGANIVFKDIYDKDITISDDNSVSIGDNGKHLYNHHINIFSTDSDNDIMIYLLINTSEVITKDNITRFIDNGYFNSLMNSYSIYANLNDTSTIVSDVFEKRSTFLQIAGKTFNFGAFEVNDVVTKIF